MATGIGWDPDEGLAKSLSSSGRRWGHTICASFPDSCSCNADHQGCSPAEGRGHGTLVLRPCCLLRLSSAVSVASLLVRPVLVVVVVPLAALLVPGVTPAFSVPLVMLHALFCALSLMSCLVSTLWSVLPHVTSLVLHLVICFLSAIEVWSLFLLPSSLPCLVYVPYILLARLCPVLSLLPSVLARRWCTLWGGDPSFHPRMTNRGRCWSSRILFFSFELCPVHNSKS